MQSQQVDNVPQGAAPAAARRTTSERPASERPTSERPASERPASERPARHARSIEDDIASVGRIGAVPTILRVVSEVTGLRLALIARVTNDNWTACAVLDRMNFGLHVGSQLAVATTLCSEVRDSHEPIIIEHASIEPAFCAHPTPKMYGFESYIAVPIFRRNGEYFGNVCALDSAPATLRDEKTVAMMRLFAELVSLQLADEEQAVRDKAALSLARENAELREQFIAVLGHDLRNPLFAVLAGSGFLLGLAGDDRQRNMLVRIQSAGERMLRLIENIMDFARGRLGGGIALSLQPVAIAEVVNDVVAEIASAHPERTIRVTVAVDGTSLLDRTRVAQLLSNLVGNAVQHSPRHEAVDVRAESSGEVLRLAVTNRGEPIPADIRARLFQPYVRSAGDQPRPGLGLGLYISSQIARAHGGWIAVQSTDDGVTTFTVELPRDGGELA